MLSIRLDPAEVDMGGARPVTLAGTFSASGYDLQLSGPSDLARMTTIGAAAGWIKPISSDWHLAGSADLALHLGGPWFEASGFESPASPHPAGTLHLTHVSATPPFLPGTVTVESASLDFASAPNSSGKQAAAQAGLPLVSAAARLRWTGISANWNGAHFDGTVDRALVCGPQPADCPWHINLHASALSTAVLNRAFRARSNGLLSGLLPSSSSLSQNFSPQNFLPQNFSPQNFSNQHFIGSIRADSFLLGQLPLTSAVAEIEIQNNSLHLVSFSGRAIGGQIGAHGTFDFAHQKHAVGVELAGGNLQDAGALFHEDWGHGALSFSCDLKLAGVTAAELRSRATGHCAWSIDHGGLTALTFSETPLAHFDQLSGTAKVNEELLQLDATTAQVIGAPAGRATNPSGRPFELTGSVGFSRSIALHLTASPDSSPIVITGSVESPQIQHPATPEIQSLPKN